MSLFVDGPSDEPGVRSTVGFDALAGPSGRASGLENEESDRTATLPDDSRGKISPVGYNAATFLPSVTVASRRSPM